MSLDRLQWQPAIYEHKSALIDRSPMEVANDANLFCEALLREYELYRPDFLTVGLDVYNVEVEALGAGLTAPGSTECPDIDGLLYKLPELPNDLNVPRIPESGRFQMLLDVAASVKRSVGDSVPVRVAASGPITLAAKLVGMEDLILSLCMQDGLGERLLAFTTDIAVAWLSCIREHGHDAVVFDSMAAPPMFSPDMFESVALPPLRRLMDLLADSGQAERELVIGGNSSPVAGLLKETGATILLCDYAADATEFKASIGDDRAIRIRRNISPAALMSEDHALLAKTFAEDLSHFSNPIAGTGILPYDFKPEVFLSFKQKLSELHVGRL